jgi:peptidoglycan/xylan/chitin deacetylase (PgdA/CDA1 family)
MRQTKTATLVALGVLTVLAMPALFLSTYQPFWLVRAAQRHFPDVVFYVETRERAVALTLDDGPETDVTPRVLEVLRTEGVRATWFVMGERVQRHPDVLRSILADGHEIANHQWDDRAAVRMGRGELRETLARTERLLQQPTDRRFWRPASGWFRGSTLDVAREAGYTPVLGSAYASDPAGPPRWYLRWALVRMARPGAIVVLHVGPGRGRTADVLPALIRGVREKGLRFVTLGELAALRRAGADRLRR